ncbi:MAG: hypothetical protein RJQ04_21580 [Longimicrobiales bacterium]
MTPQQDPRRGSSLVEVVVAIIVLAYGLLGLGGMTTYVVRQVTLADITTDRAMALQSVLDRVQAMDYDSVGTGADSVGVFHLTWTSTSETAQSKLVTVITAGPGLATAEGTNVPMLVPSVPDTFVYRVLRP